MAEKVTMVAQVSHITSDGMVRAGDTFEVTESGAKGYEKREKRPLAVREEDASDATEKTAGKSGSKGKGKSAAKKTADSDS